jgi:hypothetical protein
MNSTRGSFQLRAQTASWAGVAPISNPDPALFSVNEMITRPLNLNGLYRLKIKSFDSRWNQNFVWAQPAIFWVCDNIVDRVTNDKCVSLYVTGLPPNSYQGITLDSGIAGSMDHEVIADIRGSITWNAVFGNPFYGNVTAYPASDVKNGTYVAGNPTANPAQQVIFNAKPSFYIFTINIDYELIQ